MLKVNFLKLTTTIQATEIKDHARLANRIVDNFKKSENKKQQQQSL